jgi:hypothetical protein
MLITGARLNVSLLSIKKYLSFAILLFVVLLSGCARLEPNLPDELSKKYSQDRPKPTLTDFNSSLVCMDNLMLLSKSQPIYITSQGLFNYTAEHSISRGGKRC